MKPIIVPGYYDYVGIYVTNKCHLHCFYCVTEHFGTAYKKNRSTELTPDQWIEGLNRLVLPRDIPITLQGGEPFIYKGIWKILENITHKVDIMTALPPTLKRENFLKLKTLDWNKREAPYPTIRVSYHKGQNDFEDLIPRIAELQDILSIGLYYFGYPINTDDEIVALKACAQKYGVELREKEFLGEWNGKHYGRYQYKDASAGKRLGIEVLCKNSVAVIGHDGDIYHCHSDHYFNKKELVLGNILDKHFEFPAEHLPCSNYGLCSACDVKIKTNHLQIDGYTSVDIKFPKSYRRPET